MQKSTTLFSSNILGVLSSGCSYGLENDTSMMMMMATPEEFDTNSITTNQDCHDFKISSDHHLSNGKRRSEPSILKLYAMKLGLNDRGCYISCALAALAFSLFVIVVTLAACWPGKLKDFCITHSNTMVRRILKITLDVVAYYIAGKLESVYWPFCNINIEIIYFMSHLT